MLIHRVRKHWKLLVGFAIVFNAIVYLYISTDEDVAAVREFVSKNERVIQETGGADNISIKKILTVGGSAGIYGSPVEYKQFRLLVKGPNGKLRVVVKENYKDGVFANFAIESMGSP